MKRVFIVFVVLVFACVMLAACTRATMNEPPSPEPAFEETEAPVDAEEAGQIENDAEPAHEDVYSVEQIQSALNDYIVGPDGERGRVIVVEKVERDRDSITMGEVEQRITFDLSQAARYEVTYEIRFKSDLLYRISIDVQTGEEVEYRQWHGDDYVFEGDYVIFTHTEYYYFNDENGNPVLTAWHC